MSSWSARLELRPSDVIVVQRTMRSLGRVRRCWLSGVPRGASTPWRYRRATGLNVPIAEPSIRGRVHPIDHSTMSPRLTWS